MKLNMTTAAATPSSARPTTSLLSSIVSYPSLLSHEEAIIKHPYDVQGWILYLSQIDGLLDALNEAQSQAAASKTTRKDSKLITIGGRQDMKPSLFFRYKKELLAIRSFVGTRATRLLPGSYKIWRCHLLHLMAQLTHTYSAICSDRRNRFTAAANAFELCLMRLSKMPRIWLDYLHLVTLHNATNVTHIRRLFNRCLEALPVTQHATIWPVMLNWASPTASAPSPSPSSVSPPLPAETTLRTMRRYALYYDTSARETLAAKCLELNRPGEAAWMYWNVMNDTTFMSPSGSTRADIWMALANVCTQYPEESLKVGIDFAALVRHALVPTKHIWTVLEEETTDGEELASAQPSALLHLGELEGSLWGKLADYYTRMGDFDMARSTYEEGMEAVTKVRDFSILFDAYMKLEEGIVEAMMEEQGNDEQSDDNEIENNESHDPDDWDILLVSQDPGSHHHMADMELALARAEHLTMRRPLLLNRVLLHQNPHNVGEWLRRAELYQQQQQDQTTMACAALEEALTKIHARKAMNGTPSLVVLALLKLYEASSLDKARHLMERICHKYEYTFANVDDLAQCYSAWVELELRHEAWDEALSIARQAVAAPDGTATSGPMAKLVRNLNKSIRLWDLLLDLEESLGSLATTKDAYSRALEMKVATPMHVLNFASFLKEQKYFEEAFSAYERGVEMFTFPASKLLWNAYLADFIERYKGQKVERVRDLFERCLEGCPAEGASEFCIMNGAFEEEFGLTNRALNAYKRMCQLVPKEEKYKAYQLYIAKTTKYMGVTNTRDIYQEAISCLDDEPAAKLCMDFSKMETSLQELERARAVLAYGAQMADPRRLPEYWKKWHDFEVSHGNEETFREMLRIKRSVQASFSTVNYNAIGMDQDLNPLSDEQAMSMIADQEGVDYNQIRRKEEASNNNVFVSQKKRSAGDAQLEDVENRVAKLRKATGAAFEHEHAGDDEIDIDDLENEEDDGDAPSSRSPVQHVSTKAIPTAVFGGLVNG